MYVTRPLSRYLANPMAAAEAPPEGPGSGFLVVVDEAAVEQARTCCWGLCRDRAVRSLPFPQSLQLSLKQDDTPHPAETAVDCASEILGSSMCLDVNGGRPPGLRTATAPDYAVFVPVVGEPLSSSRYYVVRADGKHTGKVSACSREEDKTACCFCSVTNDVPPRSFERGDVYQQVEVQQLAPGKNGFRAVTVAGDGIPPDYLRKKKGWKVVGMASPTYDLADDAQGVDAALRARMPDGLDGAGAVVGRWYVPFLFVKADGERRLKDQFRRCTFYKMTLEQSWEQMYSRERDREGSEPPEEVTVTAAVRRFTALLGGTDAVQPQADENGGAMWFRPPAAGTTGVGLDMVLWEGMKWEVDKGGWVAGPPAMVRVTSWRWSRGWRGVTAAPAAWGSGAGSPAICWWRGSCSGGRMAASHSPASSGLQTRSEPSGYEIMNDEQEHSSYLPHFAWNKSEGIPCAPLKK